METAIARLQTAMTNADPQALGMFFAEIGLEASPDEIFLWSDMDFYDLIMDFAPAAPDTAPPDSLLPLVESLPLELLEKREEEEVTMVYGSHFIVCSHPDRISSYHRGVFQPS